MKKVTWLLMFIGGVAQAQMCPIPGNPCQGGDAASQSSVNGATGVGNPIDVTNGNKYQLEVDLPGTSDLSLQFRRHYNSLGGESPEFGRGWSTGFGTRLGRSEQRTAAGSERQIVVTQGDGRLITFKPSGEPRDGVQRYASQPAGYGIIEETIAQIDRLRAGKRNAVGVASEDANQLRPWTWRWANGRRLAFDGFGRTRRISDADGDRLDFDYDSRGRLHQARDAFARSATFAYWDDAVERLTKFEGGDKSATVDAQPAGARGRLKSLTGPDGSAIRYGYNDEGQLSGVWFADGTTTRYEYTKSAGFQRLTRIVGRDGKVVGEYGYDEYGRAVSTSATGGLNKIELEYRLGKGGTGESWLRNSRGEVSVYRWRYREGAHEAQIVEAVGPGCATCAPTNLRYAFDDQDRVVRIEKLSPGLPSAKHEVLTTELIERDAFGRIAARFNLAGKEKQLIERLTYPTDDPLAPPTKIERASVKPGASSVMTVRYNSRQQPVELVEEGFAPLPFEVQKFAAVRRAIQYSYFDNGKLKSIDGPAPGTDDLVAYEYDAAGRLAFIRHPLKAVESFRYDALGHLIGHTPLDGVAIDFKFDAAGRMTALTRSALVSTMSYDAAGRIEKMTDPLGQRFTFGYDAASRPTSVTDGEGVRIQLDLDGEGRAVRRRLLNPDGSVAQEFAARPEEDVFGDDVTKNSWSPAMAAVLRLPTLRAGSSRADAAAMPWQLDIGAAPRQALDLVEDARGLVSRYLHDDFGQLVGIDNPDAGSVQLRYDAAGRVTARLAVDGRKTEYTRDALGRLTRITTSDESVAIDYGAHGKPVRIGFGVGSEEIRYDAQARVVERIRLIDGHRFSTGYSYDALGRVDRKTLPDGQQLVYRYNGPEARRPGVLNAILRKDLLGTTVIVEGLNDTDDTPNRERSTFGNGLAFIREVDSKGAIVRYGTASIADFNFETRHGQITQSRNGGNVDAFEYDAARRVVGSSSLGAAGTRRAMGISYDWANNILAHGSAAALQRYSIDDHSNRISHRQEINGTRTQFSYDAAGRTAGIGQRHYTYDGAGRLKEVREDSRLVAEYAYDGFGERIRKVAYSGDRRTVTYYFHDGSQLVAEADGEGEITRQYVYLEDRPVGLLVGKDIYSLHTDWRGSPVAATDKDRKVVWRGEVDAWLRTSVTRSDITLNLRGSNQYYDAESGLHYNIARYFDPESGRYLTPDPLGQAGARNLYAFVEGDPVNRVDPLGLQSMPSWEQDRASAENTDIGNWEFARRLRFVLMTAAENSDVAIRDALLEMITPQAIAITAGVMLAWAASQLTPYGWAADLVLLGVGYFFMGKAILDLAIGTGAMILGAQSAGCIRDLRNAGREFANVMAHAAIDLGGGSAARGAAKVGNQLRRIFGGRRATPRLPPPPPPRGILTRIGEVLDSVGSRIPSFSAGNQYRWTRPAGGINAIGAAFESAVVRFLRGHHQPRYLIEPKLPGNQGFDVAYLRADGKLVIGEAKSNNGNISNITAFGSTRVETMERNLAGLERLLGEQLAQGRMSRADYDAMVTQIRNRSFETELYVSSTSNIPASRLDVFVDNLGRPLDRVIVLGEGTP